MAEENKTEHRCYWCGKTPAPHKHPLIKDNSTSEQESEVHLCKLHDTEMQTFRRKRVGGEL